MRKSRTHSHDSRVEETKEERKPKAPKRNLNVEAAYLHILGDVLNSLGVIIASAFIYFDESYWYLDPVCTLFFACIVFYTTRITFWQCCDMLMEATPDEYDTEEIEKALEKISGVDMVTDLHLWSLSSGKFALNVHLRLLEGAQNAQQEVLHMADKLLRKKFNINHLTI